MASLRSSPSTSPSARMMRTRRNSFLPHINRRRRPLMAVILLASILLWLSINNYAQKISYLLRPLWDTPPKPFTRIPHLYSPGTPLPRLCALHGFGTARLSPRKVFDAVLFSNELDVLEVRLRELAPHVHRFVILESNSTFTGATKPLFFSDNRGRFSFAGDKIVSGVFAPVFMDDQYSRRVREPFQLEYQQRRAMDRLLRQSGIEIGDVLIMADADEIPSPQTLTLLRWCDAVPRVMHFELREYLYSFEFPAGTGSWRASAHLFAGHGKTRYAHSRQGDLMLADAGWHCSFCFRDVDGVAFKMQAYSHADRVRSPALLDRQRIQRILCSGEDLFDMLPEGFSFREILGRMGPLPRSASAVNLPSSVVDHADRFQFLLPGGCIRSRPPSYAS